MNQGSGWDIAGADVMSKEQDLVKEGVFWSKAGREGAGGRWGGESVAVSRGAVGPNERTRRCWRDCHRLLLY